MTIDVTQADIDEAGHRCDNCPIARAVKRALNLENVQVYARSTHVLNVVYPNTEEMERFVIAFDNNGFVEPEAFFVKWDKIK